MNILGCKSERMTSVPGTLITGKSPKRAISLLCIGTVALIFLTFQSWAQLRDVYTVQNYDRKVYEGHAQNWAIAQGADGLMYFSNNEGVLEFDGERWRKIAVPGNQFVQSFALGADSILYFCTQNDLGSLVPDAKGQLKYQSFKAELDSAWWTKGLDFAECWAAEEGIYFVAAQRILLRAYDGVYTLWESPSRNFRSQYVNGRLYVTQEGSGLTYLSKGHWNTLPNTDWIKQERLL